MTSLGASRRPRVAVLAIVCGLLVAACGGETTGTSADAVDPIVDRVSYAVSHILVRIDEAKDEGPGVARQKAWRIYDRLLAGESFAAVARQDSEADNRADGGFLGFLEPMHDTAFAGALRALAPGRTSLPLRTALGYQIIHRHPYDEGIRLERQQLIPTFGFVVPFEEGTTHSETRDVAERVLAQLRNGELTFAAAHEQFAARRNPGPQPTFYGLVARRDGFEPIFDALKGQDEGMIVGPIPIEVGLAIVQRGDYMRAIVRHILVRHREADRRSGRTPEAAMALAKQVLARVKADPTRWDRQVKDFSDDEMSRGDGGTWRTIGTGIMPIAIEQAVRATPRGQIVPEVVASDLGYHVIQRVK